MPDRETSIDTRECQRKLNERCSAVEDLTYLRVFAALARKIESY